jgi:hypothetical protein
VPHIFRASLCRICGLAVAKLPTWHRSLHNRCLESVWVHVESKLNAQTLQTALEQNSFPWTRTEIRSVWTPLIRIRCRCRKKQHDPELNPCPHGNNNNARVTTEPFGPTEILSVGNEVPTAARARLRHPKQARTSPMLYLLEPQPTTTTPTASTT